VGNQSFLSPVPFSYSQFQNFCVMVKGPRPGPFFHTPCSPPPFPLSSPYDASSFLVTPIRVFTFSLLATTYLSPWRLCRLFVFHVLRRDPMGSSTWPRATVESLREERSLALYCGRFFCRAVLIFSDLSPLPFHVLGDPSSPYCSPASSAAPILYHFGIYKTTAPPCPPNSP